MDFDFPEFSFGDDPEEEHHEEQTESVKVRHRWGHRHIARKLTSEAALSDAMAWHFQEGDCFHCFSWGDVDALTYVRHVLRQQRVLYLAISTWCMAGEDVEELREWHRRGMLGRVDFFMGEIFPGSYSEVYAAAVQLAAECGGRVVVFRNHAKVSIIVGERFDVLIESSANVNTNPRCENTVLTVDRQLVAEYVEMFNGIRTFGKEISDVKPYEIPRERSPHHESDHGEGISREDPLPVPQSGGLQAGI